MRQAVRFCPHCARPQLMAWDKRDAGWRCPGCWMVYTPADHLTQEEQDKLLAFKALYQEKTGIVLDGTRRAE